MDLKASDGLELVNWIVDRANGGVRPLSSASDLAKEYLIDQSYPDHDERVASLINWETSKNFTTGFITGLGGLITLPVAVPAALGASWVIQARMSGAIAAIFGHDLTQDKIKTFVLLTIVGDSVKEVLKKAGVEIGNKLTKKVITSIPGRLFTDINKQVGFRLLTKAGEKGVINLTKLVPVAGGLISGVFDAYACRKVGKRAHKLFRNRHSAH